MGASEFGFIPGDNDGPVFDNTKPTFFTNNGGSGDRIDVWEITPDYDEPTDSTIAEVQRSRLLHGPVSFAVPHAEAASLSQVLVRVLRNNVTWLESLAGRLMHRGQTRDFGKRKKALLSHTVAADENGKAGVHWYELWNDKDKGWKLKKEETFSPDGDNRWMGSIAMNAAGQTCLGYSISSETTYPSIGIAGRNGTANHMNVPELLAFDGNTLATFKDEWPAGVITAPCPSIPSMTAAGTPRRIPGRTSPSSPVQIFHLVNISVGEPRSFSTT